MERPVTLPNTPVAPARLDAHSLARIRSLTKLDIRSPLLRGQFSPNESFDGASVHTGRSNRTIASRLLALVPRRSRNFYNDFTTIDWAHAHMKTNKFNFEVSARRTTEGRPMLLVQLTYYALSRWLLILVIAFVFSVLAFAIDKVEILLVGLKHGYCRTNWFASQLLCCGGKLCPAWVSWHEVFPQKIANVRVDFFIYVLLTVALALVAVLITLTTRIPARFKHEQSLRVYTAAGSGVPEVRTILSGFVIRRFLGSYTLVAKTTALIFSIALGMALGKEGPYVHLATCVGNVALRLFPHISLNDLLKKQILSASASLGVALAFGSPLGGVLFILEEINHYLPLNQLFLIFFCAITSTLFLKFLDPYGTQKTVLFELSYTSDWQPYELVFFTAVGVAGGCFGAAFIRFSTFWSRTFRRSRLGRNPVVEVLLVSLATGLVSFWNPYLKQAALELVLDLATSCRNQQEPDPLLCPVHAAPEMAKLAAAFAVKVLLTFTTFGLKVPSGIYVPSMVAGALFGRIFAMAINQLQLNVDAGIYAMISAGAFMAGVTRMNITLATILFELTSSYTYVLPIAISIAVANWFGGLLEEKSLYEAVLAANDYPFLSPDADLVDPRVTAGELLPLRDTYTDEGDDRLFVDVSTSPYVPVPLLRLKLALLAQKHMGDGCVPFVCNNVCVGTVCYSELELSLDTLREFCGDLDAQLCCRVVSLKSYKNPANPNTAAVCDALDTRSDSDYFRYASEAEYAAHLRAKAALVAQVDTLTNLEPVVDTCPIFLNHDAALPLAHLLFERIGTRVLVLQKRGRYFGVLHKKTVVDYCRRGSWRA